MIDRPSATTPTCPRAFVPALRARPPVHLAILCGSASRGTTRPDRDVDVAILTHESVADDSVDVARTSKLALAARVTGT